MERAREHFNKGVELFEKDDFVAAIEQFELADKEHHSPTILYNLARARESLGQAQAAYDAYEAYLSEAGGQGEFLDAATVALSRVKARATRLRVETEPPGATIRVDGVTLRDKSPAMVLLFRGQHRVDAELEGWVGGRDYQARGEAERAGLRIDRPRPPSVAKVFPKKDPVRLFGGLTAGVGFSLFYAALVAKSDRPSTQPGTEDLKYTNASLIFGMTLEAGYALTARSLLSLRGNCGLGSTQKALFSLGTLSAAYSWRATPDWWVGGGGILGSTDEATGATYSPILGARPDDSIVWGSNLAVGPVGEVGYVLGSNDQGMWTLASYPSLLLGTGQGQSTLFVPIVVGHRWY